MKFLNRARLLIKQAKGILDEYGLAVLIKKAILFCISLLFRYRKYVIYENENLLQPPDTIRTKLQNIELLIISSLNQLERLFQDGYNFNFYYDIDMEKEWLNHGVLLFGAFLDREMVHKSWVAMSRESALKLTPFVKTIGFSNEAIIERSATNPKFLNKGIYQYVYTFIFRYTYNLGKVKVRFSSPKNNTITQHVQKKLGSKIIYTGYTVRIFYFWKYQSLRPV